jgi:hypothetical protein
MAAPSNVSETLRPKPASGQTLKRLREPFETQSVTAWPMGVRAEVSKRGCAGQSNNRTKAR